MKKFIICLAVLLVGCAALEGPANFDNNEYEIINKIYTLAETFKIGCTDIDATKLNFEKLSELSLELINYSTDIPRNSDTVNLEIPLNKMISDANIKIKTESHSTAYCKLKLDNIETTAGIIKHAMAERRIS